MSDHNRALAQDAALRAEIEQFLALEARMLDEGRFHEWFELLDEDIVYVVPTRVATEDRAGELASSAFRLRDRKSDIAMRIERIDTGNAFSEWPPSRTVRQVSSVLIEADAEEGVVAVSSALLVYRHRGTDRHGDFIPARRNDRIRLTPDGPRLLARSILLAETIVGTPNLGIFL